MRKIGGAAAVVMNEVRCCAAAAAERYLSACSEEARENCSVEESSLGARCARDDMPGSSAKVDKEREIGRKTTILRSISRELCLSDPRLFEPSLVFAVVGPVGCCVMLRACTPLLEADKVSAILQVWKVAPGIPGVAWPRCRCHCVVEVCRGCVLW